MANICSVDECDRVAVKRELCNKHYLRWRRNGTTDRIRKVGRDPCSVEGCGADSQAFGFCLRHYCRWRRTGDPTKVITTIMGEPQRFYREVVLTFDGDGCLDWPYGPKGDHYGCLWDGKRPVQVHKLVCRHFHGEPPSESHHAAHTCGNRKCCNWRHTRWATSSENNADKMWHGTWQGGERNGMAKLTEDDARQIKALAGQLSQRKIARMFGVSQPTVMRLLRGETWSHLT